MKRELPAGLMFVIYDLFTIIRTNEPDVKSVDLRQATLLEAAKRHCQVAWQKYLGLETPVGVAEEALAEAIHETRSILEWHSSKEQDEFISAIQNNYYITQIEHDDKRVCETLEKTCLKRNRDLGYISEVIQDFADCKTIPEMADGNLLQKTLLISMINAIKNIESSVGEKLVYTIERALDALKALLQSVQLYDYEQLPDSHYLKQFINLLQGHYYALGVDDKKSTYYAIYYLLKPLPDEILFRKSMSLLNGLLIDAFRSCENAELRRAIDILLIVGNLDTDNGHDSKAVELKAYARLMNLKEPTAQEMYQTSLNHAACRENFLELIHEEVHKQSCSFNELLNQCRETVSNAVEALLAEPTLTPTQNPNTFFQPAQLQETSMNYNLPNYKG